MEKGHFTARFRNRAVFFVFKEKVVIYYTNIYTHTVDLQKQNTHEKLLYTVVVEIT